MKISNALHALVARKRKDFNRRLKLSIVNVLFFKRSGKEFHAVGPAQEKARLEFPTLQTIPFLHGNGQAHTNSVLADDH